jgi:hypothetical protein
VIKSVGAFSLTAMGIGVRALLNSLLDAVRDDASHPLYSLISVVGDLIEAYEIEQEPRLR